MSAGRASLLDHPLVQLTLVRVREFTREPEAVFWALFFPILITAGLGVAFRSRPADVLKVAASGPAIAQALRQEPTLDVADVDQPAARAAAANRQGRAARRSRVRRAPSSIATTTRTRRAAPRACSRTAPSSAPPAARTRCAATDAIIREAGSRYIDFLVPGLVGLGIMSNTLWGLGFSIVDSRRRKLTKRLIATPMSRTYYLLSYLMWRMMVLVVEVGVPIGFGALAFGVPVRGRLFDLVVVCVLASLAFSALGAAHRQPRADDRGRVGPDEPRAGADVDSFRRVLLGAAIPRRRAALHQRAAADGADRRAARAHAAGRRAPQLGPQLAVLGAWLVVCFALALKLFRWR